jgi:hypothetical protein
MGTLMNNWQSWGYPSDDQRVGPGSRFQVRTNGAARPLPQSRGQDSCLLIAQCSNRPAPPLSPAAETKSQNSADSSLRNPTSSWWRAGLASLTFVCGVWVLWCPVPCFYVSCCLMPYSHLAQGRSRYFHAKGRSLFRSGTTGRRKKGAPSNSSLHVLIVRPQVSERWFVCGPMDRRMMIPAFDLRIMTETQELPLIRSFVLCAAAGLVLRLAAALRMTRGPQA